MILGTHYDRMFYTALKIRLVEQKIIELYPTDRIQSPVHLSIGQEAVAVGCCEALAPQDLVFGSYRSHAFYLAKGGDLGKFFAELYGKVTGCGRGKAGSMHLAAPEVNFMGSSAVVASTIPHAVGAALAAKRRGLDQVVLTVFGDGATEEGVYHESLNFAVLHGLPVVFLCENNGLAVHSHLEARQAYRIAEHARTYGLAVHTCAEGYDLNAVYATLSAVVTEARRTQCPQFVELRTFRYMEHVGTGEDFQVGYRSRAAAEAWQAHDPLIHDTARVERYLPHIREEIATAVRFAEDSPWPGPEELLAEVM